MPIIGDFVVMLDRRGRRKPSRHDFGILDHAQAFAREQFKQATVHAYAVAQLRVCPVTTLKVARLIEGRQK